MLETHAHTLVRNEEKQNGSGVSEIVDSFSFVIRMDVVDLDDYYKHCH